jgi:hypothetical protein
MSYCPNCNAELKAGVQSCWNCKALFDANSAWTPTTRPLGAFRSFPPDKERDRTPKKAYKKPQHPAVVIAARAVAAAIFFIPLSLAIAYIGVLSGPSTGESPLGLIWLVVGVLLIVWVVWPLQEFGKRKRATDRDG